MPRKLKHLTTLLVATGPILAALSCMKEDVTSPATETDLASGAAAGQSKKSSTSKIAFNSWDGGTAAIYVVNPDGTGLTKLTPEGEDDRRPLWSPDRSKIAFVRNTIELWVMTSDGRNRVKLTNHLADGEGVFRWSPDGNMIAFERNDAEVEECQLDEGELELCPVQQIWTVRSDGSKARKVTDGEDPSWAPNGRRIALARRG